MIYKVLFSHKKEYLSKIGDKLPLNELNILEDILKEYPSISIRLSRSMELYIICTEIKMITIKTILSKYRLKMKIENITTDILYDKINLNKLFEEKEKWLDIDYFTKDEFLYHYNICVKRNKTIDFVLDKINEFGIENLTENDYDVLKNKD